MKVLAAETYYAVYEKEINGLQEMQANMLQIWPKRTHCHSRYLTENKPTPGLLKVL